MPRPREIVIRVDDYTLQMVTVKMPTIYVKGLEALVQMGRYGSRSEAIRAAVRDLLRRELWHDIIPIDFHVEERGDEDDGE